MRLNPVFFSQISEEGLQLNYPSVYGLRHTVTYSRDYHYPNSYFKNEEGEQWKNVNSLRDRKLWVKESPCDTDATDLTWGRHKLLSVIIFYCTLKTKWFGQHCEHHRYLMYIIIIHDNFYNNRQTPALFIPKLSLYYR